MEGEACNSGSSTENPAPRAVVPADGEAFVLSGPGVGRVRGLGGGQGGSFSEVLTVARPGEAPARYADLGPSRGQGSRRRGTRPLLSPALECALTLGLSFLSAGVRAFLSSLPSSSIMKGKWDHTGHSQSPRLSVASAHPVLLLSAKRLPGSAIGAVRRVTLGNFPNFSGPQFPQAYTWWGLAVPGDDGKDAVASC